MTAFGRTAAVLAVLAGVTLAAGEAAASPARWVLQDAGAKCRRSTKLSKKAFELNPVTKKMLEG